MAAEIINMNNYRAPAVLPEEIKALQRWLVWRLTQIPGEKKPRKIPYYASGEARSGDQGTESDRNKLVTFARAVAACAKGNYSGVGLAILPDSGIVALDFDDVVVNGEIRPDVLDIIAGTYSEFSPSGNGVRAFFKGSMPSKKDNDRNRSLVKGDEWFSVEFFGVNGFVTVTGNVTPECQLFGDETTLAPITPAVRELYKRRFGEMSLGTMGLGGPGSAQADVLWAIASPSERLGLSQEQIVELLGSLPKDLSYDDWVKVGMAVHHETEGKGFDLWHEWSKTSPKYTTEKYASDRWRSFGKYSSGAHVTMRWVKSLSSEVRAHEKYDALAQWKTSIAQTAEEFQLREKVCKEIAKDTRLGELEREALAQALFDRFKAMGNKYPIAQCRKLVAEKRQPKARSEEGVPKWLKGWVYITDEDRFYRIDSDEMLTMQGFNAKFNREMPVDEDGSLVKSASWHALEDIMIPTVTRGVYLPWADEQFELDGVQCVNLFRKSSLPAAAEWLTEDGQKAVDLVVRHIDLICGGRVDVRDMLIAWMAHNVQRPGVKIRWAPLIKGIEGDGKTLLGTVMAAVLGRSNVKNISPKVLGTDFTGWALGACVGVLEEIKLTGHNRYDILNALKPYVTNDSVEVHPKGKDPYEIINTQNYIAFTNFSDALPIGETDRRWFIIFTRFAGIAEMAAALGVGVGAMPAYFDEIYAAIQLQRAELRRWLLDYQIPSSFKPNGQAPITDEKRVMISMSSSPEEDIAREVIELGAPGVTKDVLSSSCLVRAMQDMDPELLIQTTAVNRLLGKLGWLKYPRKVKWEGAAHTVWTRGPSSGLEPAALRVALDKNGSASEAAGFDDLFSDPTDQQVPSDDLFG